MGLLERGNYPTSFILSVFFVVVDLGHGDDHRAKLTFCVKAGLLDEVWSVIKWQVRPYHP